MIFIDTGAFLARFVKRDQHHAEALAIWNELLRSGEPCVTSNVVLSETLTLLARRTDYSCVAFILQTPYKFSGRLQMTRLRPLYFSRNMQTKR